MTYESPSAVKSAVTTRATSRRSRSRLQDLLTLLSPFVTICHDVWTIALLVWRNPHGTWLHMGSVLLLHLALTSSSWSLFILPNWASGYCTPGGVFQFDGIYDPWASEHMFQITVGFGNLSFTQAKVIDVIWDIVIGRGGQFILSSITFVVFSKCLSRILERPCAAVAYDTFRAIVFESPSISTIFRYWKDLKHQTEWYARLYIVWFIVASTYVMVFPTFTSAMTGYSTNVNPYFEFNRNEKQALTNQTRFSRAIYRIEDSNRIEGLELNVTYLVGSTPFSRDRTTPDFEYFDCLLYAGSFDSTTPSATKACLMAYAVSSYVMAYSASESMDVGSNFTFNQSNYPIKSPLLNISIFNTGLNRAGGWYVNYLTPFSTGLDTNITSGPLMYAIENQNEVYSAEELNTMGSCDSESTYMWGFSFLLLFSFLIVTGIWALVMYAMWSDAFWNSQLDVAGRRMGFYRGVVDVSNAMRKDTLQDMAELTPDRQIRDMLAICRHGGKITYDKIDRDKLPPPRSVHFVAWKRSVASLCGWTDTWEVLHWLEWILLSGVGITLVISGPRAGALGMVYYVTGGLFCLYAVILMCIGLGCAIRRWCSALQSWTSPSPWKKGDIAILLSEEAPESISQTSRPEFV